MQTKVNLRIPQIDKYQITRNCHTKSERMPGRKKLFLLCMPSYISLVVLQNGIHMSSTKTAK